MPTHGRPAAQDWAVCFLLLCFHLSELSVHSCYALDPSFLRKGVEGKQTPQPTLTDGLPLGNKRRRAHDHSPESRPPFCTAVLLQVDPILQFEAEGGSPAPAIFQKGHNRPTCEVTIGTIRECLRCWNIFPKGYYKRKLSSGVTVFPLHGLICFLKVI